VKSKSAKLLDIRYIQEKLKTLCSRVDNLENMISRNNNNNDELQVVKSEEPSDLGNRQEQEKFYFLNLMFFYINEKSLFNDFRLF